MLTIDPDRFGADREAVRRALDAENIEARPVWKPMHLQPVFAGYKYIGTAVMEEFFPCPSFCKETVARRDAGHSRLAHAKRRFARQRYRLEVGSGWLDWLVLAPADHVKALPYHLRDGLRLQKEQLEKPSRQSTMRLSSTILLALYGSQKR